MEEAAMEEREARDEETAAARVPLNLPFIPRSEIPVESRRRRAVRRTSG
jgi:hypothetical protein